MMLNDAGVIGFTVRHAIYMIGLGLALMVLGVLEASNWGWLRPVNSPIEPFGFSLTLFVIGLGAALLWAFVRWQRRRETVGRDPLVHLDLLKVPALRSGLISLFSQNLILMGIFDQGFALYIQSALQGLLRALLAGGLALLVFGLVLALFGKARFVLPNGLAILPDFPDVLTDFRAIRVGQCRLQ